MFIPVWLYSLYVWSVLVREDKLNLFVSPYGFGQAVGCGRYKLNFFVPAYKQSIRMDCISDGR